MAIQQEALERARSLAAIRSAGIHRELVEAALGHVERETAVRGWSPWIDIPVAVHQRLGGTDEQALALAVVTTLLHASLGLAGGGLTSRQAAALMVYELAPAAIAHLDAPRQRQVALREALGDRASTLSPDHESALYARLAALLATPLAAEPALEPAL